MAAANPKALLLFTAFVPQFLAVGADPTVAMLLGGAAYIAIEGAVACGYVLAGATLRRGAVGVDVGRWADAVAGVVFTGLAGALVVTPRRS